MMLSRKKFLFIMILFLLALGIFSQASKDILKKYPDEEYEEEPKEKLAEKSSSDNSDWEKELDKELQDLEDKQNKFQDARGTTAPVSGNANVLNKSAQNLMMDVSVALDMVGAYDKNKPQKTTENKLDVRTAEFGFYGAVDQWLRGYFLAAAHNENGEYNFEVHEAWIQLPFLPFNTSLKAGMLFMDIGRLNKVHSHDRPFTEAPIVHQKFIGWESLFDTGAEFSILFPWKFITQELVIGSVNGRKWGHSHTDGMRKNNPLVYAHFKNFYYFGNNWGTQFGITGIRYEMDADSRNQRYLYGADFVLRWNQSNLKEFMLMAEYWYNKQIYGDTINYQNFTYDKPPNQIAWGHYIFADYKFHQLWSIGYRYDFFKDESLKDSAGYGAHNAIEANMLQITFHSSEFGKIRASLERRYIRDESNANDPERIDQRFYIQGVAILGSHPAHTY